MKYDVFISYARRDFDEVKAFVEMLKARIPTLTCWFDVAGIEPGEGFEGKIITALDSSTYVLFALSDNSMQSPWTRNEVMYAKQRGRRVVPILLKGASLKDGWFLFNFGRIDCIDSTDTIQNEKLIKNLSRWTGKPMADAAVIPNPPVPNPDPIPPLPKPKRKIAKILLWSMAAIVVLVSLLFSLYLKLWNEMNQSHFASFSPDGKYIVSASDDKTVRMWDVATEECVHLFEGHTDWVRSASFSPDGKYIVSASDDMTVRIWDVEKGECIKIFEGHKDIVLSASFSPDGQYIVSASADNTVRIWDVETEETITVRGHKDWIRFASFSPDGKYIVTASDDMTVRVRDVETKDIIGTFKGHTDWVRSASFSPDGKYIVSASDDKTVRMWEVETEECIKTIDSTPGY